MINLIGLNWWNNYHNKGHTFERNSERFYTVCFIQGQTITQTQKTVVRLYLALLFERTLKEALQRGRKIQTGIVASVLLVITKLKKAGVFASSIHYPMLENRTIGCYKFNQQKADVKTSIKEKLKMHISEAATEHIFNNIYSVLFFEEHLFLDFFQETLCVYQTDTNFPGRYVRFQNRYKFPRRIFCSLNRYHFSRGLFMCLPNKYRFSRNIHFLLPNRY